MCHTYEYVPDPTLAITNLRQRIYAWLHIGGMGYQMTQLHHLLFRGLVITIFM